MRINNLEWRRQIFHLLLGVILVVLLMFNFIDENFILVTTLIGLFISFIIRKKRIPIIWDILKKFERKEELYEFPGKGTIFYFLGVYVSLLLFPKDIALASIMVLAFGDSVSHLFGLHFGKTKTVLSSTKLLEGTIAGFIAGFLGALIFVSPLEAFFASLIAMIAEAIEIKIKTERIDDNLIIPFIAGSAIWVIRYFI
ncbi:MAG TPA: hypothetical protein VJI97_02665 [Candidatus Nanoarchaeia archaeon]|nr:hypothetical protein [Candidatus Nanoarchaeia archaeon]